MPALLRTMAFVITCCTKRSGVSGPKIFAKSSIRICTKAETWKKLQSYASVLFGKWKPLCCSSGPSCKPGLSSRGCLVPRRLRDWTRSSCSPEISLSMFLWLDGYIFQSTLVIVIHKATFLVQHMSSKSLPAIGRFLPLTLRRSNCYRY